MVSVIIPTYGGSDHVENVVESILKQTYKNIELIIVDDNGYGSENQKKTAEALKKYIENNQIQYIPLEKNSGGSAARNRGARASNGNYLMFLDDDDTVSPDKIEKQVKSLSSSDCQYGFSYCSTNVFVDGKLSNTITASQSGDILYKYMTGKIHIGTGTALMLREAWESLGGYDESFVRHQDWEFFARVLNKYDAVAVPDVYFNRNITNRNLPQNLDKLEKYADHYIKFLKTYKFHISDREIRNIININNSRVALQCVKRKEFKRCFGTLAKYDNFFRAYITFFGFCASVCMDKITGKKS